MPERAETCSLALLARVRRERDAISLMGPLSREGELFIDNLLVRIHLIIEMILVDRPCAMEV
jgi:hypothetical protein